MNTTDVLNWLCNNQAVVLAILATMPVASAVTWFTGLYNRLPPWAQFVLHVLAGNYFHAFKDPPKS